MLGAMNSDPITRLNAALQGRYRIESVTSGGEVLRTTDFTVGSAPVTVEIEVP